MYIIFFFMIIAFITNRRAEELAQSWIYFWHLFHLWFRNFRHTVLEHLVCGYFRKKLEAFVPGEILIFFNTFQSISVCNVRSQFCDLLVHVENGDTGIGDIKYCNLRRKSSIKTTTVCIVYLRGLQVLCNGRFLMKKWRRECGKVSVCALRGSEVKSACNKVRKKGEIEPSKR